MSSPGSNRQINYIVYGQYIILQSGKLQKATKRRNIKLDVMPYPMTKHTSNKTYLHFK